MACSNRESNSPKLAWSIVALLVAALLFRIWLFYLDDVPFIYSDSGAYLQQSATLVPAYDRPLGYALFLRSIFAVHESLHAVVWAQTLLGVMMVAGFIWIARRYVLSTAAALLCFVFLAAFDLRNILFERWILSEALSMFLLLPYFFFLYRSTEKGRWDSYLMTGVVIACLILTRTVFVFLIPFSLLVITLFVPGGSGPKSGKRRLAILMCVSGMLPLLLGYASYYQVHNGRFALTSFDGYVLWSVVADPSLCQSQVRDEPREIICANPYAHASTLKQFRDIWSHDGPVADLQNRYRDKVFLNDVLRPLALESAINHPVSYLRQAGWFALRLFGGRVRFTEHMTHQLQANGARQVRLRFGPDHPSVSEHPPTNWVRLAPLMRVSSVYGALLLVASLAWFLPGFRKRNDAILLCWNWSYVVMVSLFGSGDPDRLYVILTLPLLLSLVSTLESAWQNYLAES